MSEKDNLLKRIQSQAVLRGGLGRLTEQLSPLSPQKVSQIFETLRTAHEDNGSDLQAPIISDIGKM